MKKQATRAVPATCILYLRQSRKRRNETEEDSLSFANQERAGRKAAESKGWPVVAVVKDHDVTGKTLDRDGFRELMDLCRSGVAGHIVVFNISRFARNLRLQLNAIYEIEQLGIDVFSTWEQENHPLTRNVMGSINEQYIHNLSAEIEGALHERAARGEHHGRPNFGYRKAKGALIPVPDELAIVREMGKRFMDGASLNSLSKWIDRLDVPTSQGGRRWYVGTVHRLITNPIYAGRARHTTTEDVPAIYEPVFSAEEWERIQARIGTRPPREKPYSSWLEGSVFHACGKPMQLLRRRKTIAFRCSTTNVAYVHDCGLPFRQAVAWKVEDAVRDILNKDLEHVLSVDAALLSTVEAQRHVQPEIERARARIEREIAKVQRARGQAEDLLLEGRRDRAWFDVKDAGFSLRLAELAEEKRSLPQPPDPQRFRAGAAVLSKAVSLIQALPDNDPTLGPILRELGAVIVSSPTDVAVRYRSPYRELLAKGNLDLNDEARSLLQGGFDRNGLKGSRQVALGPVDGGSSVLVGKPMDGRVIEGERSVYDHNTGMEHDQSVVVTAVAGSA